MTQKLYLPDQEYEKKFESTVEEVNDGDGYVILEETLFYPEGGGQPADRGEIHWEDGDAEVVDVQKSSGEVRHHLEGDMPAEGTQVSGEIDWELRYKHMRMHTAQHVVSKVVLDEYGATTAGNQIHADRSRIDFEPVEFDENDIQMIQNLSNSLIKEELAVEKTMMDREEVEQEVAEGRTNLDLIPDFVDPLRVVKFGEDLCPCGGTHVDNVEEIGNIEIVDRVSKGSNTERLEFVLN